jgi:hypothetical protein
VSVKVTINQQGIDTIKKQCQVFSGDVAEDIAEVAKGLVPVRTGRLRDSIKADKTNLAQIKVVANAPYSGYVEAKYDFMLEATKSVMKQL